MNENSLKNLKPWHPGQSGNPSGLPGRPRNRLTEAFLSDVSDTWHRHGGQILEKMAVKEPGRFADLAARCVPKDVQLSFEARMPGNLSPEDWHLMMEILEAVRQAVPGANEKPAGEILRLTLNALRAHTAKTIDSLWPLR